MGRDGRRRLSSTHVRFRLMCLILGCGESAAGSWGEVIDGHCFVRTVKTVHKKRKASCQFQNGKEKERREGKERKGAWIFCLGGFVGAAFS